MDPVSFGGRAGGPRKGNMIWERDWEKAGSPGTCARILQHGWESQMWRDTVGTLCASRVPLGMLLRVRQYPNYRYLGTSKYLHVVYCRIANRNCIPRQSSVHVLEECPGENMTEEWRGMWFLSQSQCVFIYMFYMFCCFVC